MFRRIFIEKMKSYGLFLRTHLLKTFLRGAEPKDRPLESVVRVRVKTTLPLFCLGLLAGGFVLAIMANIFAWKIVLLPLTIVLTVSFFLLAFWRLDFALYAFAAEIVVGGAGGRWLSWGPLSIRIIFFGILFALWGYHWWRGEINFHHLHGSKFTRPLLILALFFPIFWGGLGWIYHWPGRYILADANGFAFYLLFFPLASTLGGRQKMYRLLLVYLGAISVTALILTVLYFLSASGVINIWFLKQLFLGRMFYGGKIGIMPDGAYRLFTGNGIFLVTGILTLASLALFGRKIFWPHVFGGRRHAALLLGAIFFAYLAIVASYTRGFWIGIIGALLFLSIWLSFKQRLKLVAGVVVLFLVSEMVFRILFGLSFFNFFGGRLATSVSVEKDPVSLGQRVSQVRVLGGAILRHPFWGTGFGTNFPEYRTQAEVADPYSFELGYLDMVVKFGIVGFAFWALVILLIFAKGLKILLFQFTLKTRDRALLVGLLAGLLALLIVGGTSPFLMSAFGIMHIVVTLYVLEVVDPKPKIQSSNDKSNPKSK